MRELLETGDLLRVFDSKYFGYSVWSFRRREWKRFEADKEVLIDT